MLKAYFEANGRAPSNERASDSSIFETANQRLVPRLGIVLMLRRMALTRRSLCRRNMYYNSVQDRSSKSFRRFSRKAFVRGGHFMLRLHPPSFALSHSHVRTICPRVQHRVERPTPHSFSCNEGQECRKTSHKSKASDTPLCPTFTLLVEDEHDHEVRGTRLGSSRAESTHRTAPME
jgi:hypothetical protein